MSERFFDFSDPIDQDICTHCAQSWKIVVSEWWSVIAVSLNVGGGIRLIKLAKLYMCTQTHYKHNKDGRTAPGVHGHGSSEPLEKRLYKNWITHTTKQLQL